MERSRSQASHGEAPAQPGSSGTGYRRQVVGDDGRTLSVEDESGTAYADAAMNVPAAEAAPAGAPGVLKPSGIVLAALLVLIGAEWLVSRARQGPVDARTRARLHPRAPAGPAGAR